MNEINHSYKYIDANFAFSKQASVCIIFVFVLFISCFSLWFCLQWNGVVLSCVNISWPDTGVFYRGLIVMYLLTILRVIFDIITDKKNCVHHRQEVRFYRLSEHNTYLVFYHYYSVIFRVCISDDMQGRLQKRACRWKFIVILDVAAPVSERFPREDNLLGSAWFLAYWVREYSLVDINLYECMLFFFN